MINLKIKVDRQLLLTQLSYISKAIPNKTPLPVLTGIKFVVSEEGLHLTTSDSDITINTFLPLEVNDTQSFKLMRLVQSLFEVNILLKL